MSSRAFAFDLTKSTGTLVALAAALTFAAAFTTPAAAMRNTTLNADGDACTITNPDGTTTPGKERCCATADPNNCVVILKPFPTGSFRVARFL